MAKNRLLPTIFRKVNQDFKYPGVTFAGALGSLVGHPLDTIKTWQQYGNRRIRKSMYDIIIHNNGVCFPHSLKRTNKITIF